MRCAEAVHERFVICGALEVAAAGKLGSFFTSREREKIDALLRKARIKSHVEHVPLSRSSLSQS